MHGIQIVEFVGSMRFLLLPTGRDTTPPTISSDPGGEAASGADYEATLVASESARFTMRSGADEDYFRLDGATLTLAAAGRPAGPVTLVCNLRAIDDRGNRTSFTHSVRVLAPGVEPAGSGGGLDLSDENNSIAIAVI